MKLGSKTPQPGRKVARGGLGKFLISQEKRGKVHYHPEGGGFTFKWKKDEEEELRVGEDPGLYDERRIHE